MVFSLYLIVYFGFSRLMTIYLKGLHNMNNLLKKLNFEWTLIKWKMIKLFINVRNLKIDLIYYISYFYVFMKEVSGLPKVGEKSMLYQTQNPAHGNVYRQGFKLWNANRCAFYFMVFLGNFHGDDPTKNFYIARLKKK